MPIEANYLSISVKNQSQSVVNVGLKIMQLVDADALGYYDFSVNGTALGWDYDGGTTDRVEMIAETGEVETLTRVGDYWRLTVTPEIFGSPASAPGETVSKTCQIVVTRTTGGDTAANAPGRWSSKAFPVTIDRRIGFSPRRISGLVAWYSAYSLTEAVAGQVASWDDKGPYDFDLAQATSGQQPKRYNDGTGRPYLLFDGTDDNLLTAAQANGGDQFGAACTIFVAGQIDTRDATVRGVVQVGGTNGARLAFDNTNLKGISGSDVANTTLPSLDDAFVATVTKTAGGAITVKKGLAAAVTQASSASVTPGIIQIGDEAADSASAFRLYELIVFSSVLTSEQQAQIIRYLQKQWNANG